MVIIMWRLISLFLSVSASVTEPPVVNLNEVLDYYETHHHDDFKHHIRKRDIYMEDPTERSVEFNSHGQHFKLVLHKNMSVVSSDFKVLVEADQKTRSVEFNSSIYHGFLEGEPDTSSVSAYWENSHFLSATIWTKSDVFTVEPSWRHLPESSEYNMISYKGSDFKRNDEKPHSCGSMNGKDADDINDNSKMRFKRTTTRKCRSSNEKICSVMLVADHRFFKRIGNSDVATTTKYLIGVMDKVNFLFKGHEFLDCGSNFGFEIKKILIHEKPSRSHPYNNEIRWNDTYDLLRAFSSADFKEYSEHCLVHLFTAYPFSSGVLGTAHVAKQSKESTGGLCSKDIRIIITEDKSVTKLYENTAWTSYLNLFGNRVLSLQATLVTAHEFGHNWGSNHDPNKSAFCNPSESEGGKYLMFTSSVTGFQPNNKFFSKCSIAGIRDVLAYKLDIPNCFTNKSVSFCGNSEVEGDEDCDEGTNNADPCCKKCKFVNLAVCSDVNHLCCQDCRFANSSRICHQADNENCSDVTYCNERSRDCPDSPKKLNGANCMNYGVCHDGRCLSLCQQNNKIDCLCDSVNVSCKVCCQDTVNVTDVCEPFTSDNDSFFWNLIDNVQCPLGICINGMCEKLTDASLQRSWNFIQINSVSDFVKFMKNNIVGSVIVVSLLLWIPASCTVWYIDRKRERQDKDEVDWTMTANCSLIPDREIHHRTIRQSTRTVDRRNRNR